MAHFGSLADRRGVDHGDEMGNQVRHAWLDDEIPVLLVRWRRTDHGGWEGLIVGVTPHGPATSWVRAARLQAAEVKR